MAAPAQSSGLKRKVGPLPLYGWVLLAVGVVGYFVFFRGSKSSTGVAVSSLPGAATSATDYGQSTGDIPSAGSPGASDSATSDLVSALGAENSNLLSALVQTQSNVVALAQAQGQNLLASQTLPNDTTIGATVQAQPGGSNAPTVQYVFPNVTGSISSTATKAAAKTSSAGSTAKKAVTPVKYFTYKRDVPLKAGQTVHFTSGKGYYAA